jgi:OOP family OmpA-OmpF porin
MTKAISVASVLLVSASAFAAGPVLAQQTRDDQRKGANVEGLYIGGGIGDFSSSIDFTDGDNAMKLFAGWNFNRYFAVQGDYVDFGDQAGAVSPSVGGTSNVKGFAPSIVGTIPLGPVELFGRVGMMFYNLDVNLNGGGQVIDDSANDLVWSAGVGIDIKDRLNLRLEYEQIDIPQFDEANAVWLNAAWKF